jgi:HEAT repeat protein
MFRPWQHAESSIKAFYILAPFADDSIVRELVKLMNRRTRRVPERAEIVLSSLGPKGLPPLMAALDDRSRSNRWRIVTLIGHTNARPAIPLLLRSLKDPDPKVVSAASYALWRAQLDPSVLVPALIESLRDSKRMNPEAINILGAIGPAASNTVPILLKALRNQDYHLRTGAATALRKIIPEGLSKDQEREIDDIIEFMRKYPEL